MTKNKCKACGKWIPEFSPSDKYCSKVCQGTNSSKDIEVDDLMSMMGMQ